MARIKTLRHVAYGLRDAFVGRNDDLDGYWALGKLYAAADPATTSVVLDLVDGGALPPAPDCLALARRHAEFLAQALAAHGIPRHALARAEILVEFDIVPEVSIPRLSPQVARPADPFRCTVTLGDHAGRLAQARTWGYCWRHDPQRESRRNRANWGRTGTRAGRRDAGDDGR